MAWQCHVQREAGPVTFRVLGGSLSPAAGDLPWSCCFYTSFTIKAVLHHHTLTQGLDSWFIRRRTSGRRLAKCKPSKSHENQVHRLTPPCCRLRRSRHSSAGCDDSTSYKARGHSPHSHATPGSASHHGETTGTHSAYDTTSHHGEATGTHDTASGSASRASPTESDAANDSWNSSQPTEHASTAAGHHGPDAASATASSAHGSS